MGYELNAIAAVVIGGTSLQGGVGAVTGTIIGALMLGMLDNILGLSNVNSDCNCLSRALLDCRRRGASTATPPRSGIARFPRKEVVAGKGQMARAHAAPGGRLSF